MTNSHCPLLGEPLRCGDLTRLGGQARDRLAGNKAALIRGFPADPDSLIGFLTQFGAPLPNYAGTTPATAAYTLHPNINVVHCTTGAEAGSRVQEQPGPLPAHSARAFSKNRPAFIAMLMIDPGWEGGESTVVRWPHALGYMREHQPATFTSDYTLLSQTPITITASQVQDQWSTLPLLYPLPDAGSPGDIGARLSLVLASQLGAMNMRDDLRCRYRQALDRFTAAANHPQASHACQLRAGDLLILDNNRFGHGRLPFPATRTTSGQTEVNPRELWSVVLA